MVKVLKNMKNSMPIILLIILLGIFLLSSSTTVPVVNALSANTNNLTASATVNTFVETSLSGTTITFGSIDPGTKDTAASTNPITLTNTGNSNTAVDIYLNGTNMTSGANQINSSNISVWNADSATASSVLNGSTYLNSTGANTAFRENLAISGTHDFYFWIDVSAAQTAGSYTGTVQMRIVGDGATP